MKIAIVGCGALGSYYGAALARTGLDVHFLLRSDYATVRQHGVFIQSPAGDFQVRPKCARSPEEIGPCDLVIIGLKTTANAEFARLLPPLVHPATAILTLQNGLGNEEALARLFSPAQILGGLCFVCLNRLEPGRIHHLAHGRVVMGEFAGLPLARTHGIAELFRRAGVPCEVTDSLARAHWQKLVWNVPFNGYGVAGSVGVAPLEFSADNCPLPSPAACLPTNHLLGDVRWSRLVHEIMLEVIRAARALGHHIEDEYAEFQIRRTQEMGAYRASTLVDFEQGRPLEVESLFAEPLRQATAAGVAMPRLSALVRVLRRLDPANRNSVNRMSGS